ncbi:hypothetical protein PsorP6_006474 [Peronosclerospora sorghi]|uniref:Uncharacterized protein n=1 Tax=Peronosclerospora sorghi TaxID=230839 RepID=A0ACC0W568_9STRA|nr:hypothetical protein PsorP6_006474 [Peronosclerospora sorghi]
MAQLSAYAALVHAADPSAEPIVEDHAVLILYSGKPSSSHGSSLNFMDRIREDYKAPPIFKCNSRLPDMDDTSTLAPLYVSELGLAYKKILTSVMVSALRLVYENQPRYGSDDDSMNSSEEGTDSEPVRSTENMPSCSSDIHSCV